MGQQLKRTSAAVHRLACVPCVGMDGVMLLAALARRARRHLAARPRRTIARQKDAELLFSVAAGAMLNLSMQGGRAGPDSL